MNTIGVVLVTFNRLEMLKQALAKFDTQTLSPAYVLVVDNASTDGTREYLQQWEQQESPYKRQVITAEHNTGGSGGFYMGLAAAQQMEADWIWMSDDDAFPEETALARAEDFIREQGDGAQQIAAFCGAVINNGAYDLEHRRTVVIKGLEFAEEACPEACYKQPYFPLDTISYVGIIIHKPYLQSAGLTEKDFFIWFDDTEHSLRLGKYGKLLCVPGIRIHHNVPPAGQVSWKRYYGVRNRLVAIKRHYSAIMFWYALLGYVKWGLVEIVRHNLPEGKMILHAVWDALHEKLGIHPVYRPGWSPKS